MTCRAMVDVYCTLLGSKVFSAYINQCFAELRNIYKNNKILAKEYEYFRFLNNRRNRNEDKTDR